MKNLVLKNSWTNGEMKIARNVIAKYLKSRVFLSLHSGTKQAFSNCRIFSDFENILGLAYTSSSDYAGLFVCNTELYLDFAKKYKLNSFAMDDSNFIYSIWMNENENELIIPIN